MKLFDLFISSFWPMFKAGLTISVPLMLVSFALGLVLAFALALMRMSNFKPFKGIAWFVVWVIRAALGSIPKGQFEACRALGLNKMQTMRKVIIPQAALVAVPSLGNSFISLLKDTSLVSTITVAEIMMTAKTINATAFEPLLLYVEAGVVYLIFSTVLTQLQGMLEKKLGKHLVDSRA